MKANGEQQRNTNRRDARPELRPMPMHFSRCGAKRVAMTSRLQCKQRKFSCVRESNGTPNTSQPGVCAMSAVDSILLCHACAATYLRLCANRPHTFVRFSLVDARQTRRRAPPRARIDRRPLAAASTMRQIANISNKQNICAHRNTMHSQRRRATQVAHVLLRWRQVERAADTAVRRVSHWRR